MSDFSDFTICDKLNVSILACSYSGAIYGIRNAILGFFQINPVGNGGFDHLNDDTLQFIPPGLEILGPF